jgi:hypothetical protein
VPSLHAKADDSCQDRKARRECKILWMNASEWHMQ